mmetsp:Transcript_91508/g.230007  ORF Transcript_91508/g.230007 Transcript_91508/m.230007 type:complete len:211 (+) Transcript_91508:323-955(+)
MLLQFAVKAVLALLSMLRDAARHLLRGLPYLVDCGLRSFVQLVREIFLVCLARHVTQTVRAAPRDASQVLCLLFLTPDKAPDLVAFAVRELVNIPPPLMRQLVQSLTRIIHGVERLAGLMDRLRDICDILALTGNLKGFVGTLRKMVEARMVLLTSAVDFTTRVLFQCRQMCIKRARVPHSTLQALMHSLNLANCFARFLESSFILVLGR